MDIMMAMDDDEQEEYFVSKLWQAGTHIMGRGVYEEMAKYWPTSNHPSAPAMNAIPKVVFSRTLQDVTTARTRIERDFSADAVGRLKAEASRDLAVGGAELAAAAIRGGLVDEFQMFLSPVAVGGGKSFLPDGVRLRLELLEERRFGNGTVFLRYANRT
jgi:dihydrofolate reductase